MGLHKLLGGSDLHIASKQFIEGLKLVYVNAATINIYTGRCASDDGEAMIELDAAAQIIMPTDLDTGVEAADTWYYIWIFKNPTTSDVVLKFSVSHIVPTAPAGYTLKRRIGSVRNDGSSNFYEFKQHGRDKDRCYHYADRKSVVFGLSSLIWADVACASFIPATSDVGLFTVAGIRAGNVLNVSVRDKDFSTSTGKILNAYDTGSFADKFTVNSNRTIQYKVDNAAVAAYLTVDGYVEEL